MSGNGGANGAGASGGASNPMAEAFRSRGRTGPLAGGARSGGGGGGPTAVVPRESHDDALSRLLAMGFGRAAGEAALAAADGDAQRAVEALPVDTEFRAARRYLANAFPCAFSWSSNLRVGAVGEQVARGGRGLDGAERFGLRRDGSFMSPRRASSSFCPCSISAEIFFDSCICRTPTSLRSRAFWPQLRSIAQVPTP